MLCTETQMLTTVLPDFWPMRIQNLQRLKQHLQVSLPRTQARHPCRFMYVKMLNKSEGRVLIENGYTTASFTQRILEQN